MPISGIKRWGTIACAGILILGIVGWMLFPREQRPALAQTYQGRNAEEWLYHFYRSGSMAELESNFVALAELRAESVPLLAEAAMDNFRESLIDRLLKLVHEKTELLDDTLDSQSIHSRSLFALRCLQPSGPELVPLATSKFDSGLLPGSRTSAIAMLQFVETDHDACNALLKKAYASHNFDIGLAASTVIRNWELAAQPMDVLPALIDYVENTPIPSSSSDFEVLGRYGFAASNAVPVIKEKFLNAEASDKVRMTALLLKIDPHDEVASEFLVNLIKDTNHEHHTYARVLLMSCGPEQQRLAAPLWSYHQSLPESDPRRRDIVACLVNLEQPREPLLALLRESMAQTESMAQAEVWLDQLNFAWFILRLAPDDADAWRVFRSFLFVEVTAQNWGRVMLPLGTALGYCKRIPIPDEEKLKLLKEVIAHHSGTSGHEEYARRETMRQMIRIDPSTQPTDFALLWELHGD